MLRPALLSVVLLAVAAAPAFAQEPRFVKKLPAASKQTGKPGGKSSAKTPTKSAAKPAPAPAPIPAPAAVAKPPSKPAVTDAELAVRLHELVRAKGVYVASGVGGDFCRRLGSRPIGNCEVYRAEFSDAGKVTVVFYSNNDARKNALHLFITSYLDPGRIDDFRLGLDGKLERAVRRHGDASSRVDVREAAPDFKRAMDFLRQKQDQLAALPDAKVLDDGSCPAGKVKRVPGDPKDAVCLDRARLEMTGIRNEGSD
jgi:hypothetical protein